MKSDSGKADDRLVSAAYRETATELAPEHINAAVLRTAADAVRPRYSLMRTWTRPVAWAAVVMLSFALVLELTQTPVPDAGEQAPAAPAALAAPDAELRKDRQLSEFEALDNEADGFARRERVAEDVQELKLMDADIVQRAEEMARIQQGASDEPLPAAEDAGVQAVMPLPEKSSLRSTATPVESASGCDESVRAEPEAWLACIVALEESGLTELANAERELLQAAFPGFTE
jgi:hypothetical protein